LLSAELSVPVENQTFRIIRDTSAVITDDGKQKLVTIPAGSVVTVTEVLPQDTGLVAVEWERQVVKVFAVDVQLRGVPLDA
jgi:hypothetical protein